MTFNSQEQLCDLVQTIRQFDEAHHGNFVAVVENSGDPGVGGFIGQHHKSNSVLVEVTSRNEGFSHGVNLAHKLARTRWGHFDYVVLLNPDVISAGPIVCELVDRAAGDLDAAVGVWGAVLRDPDGQLDRGCARRVWNRRRLFSHLVGFDGLACIMGSAPRNLSQHEIAHDQSQLAIVSGALMCIDGRVWGEGLNTLLPMYLEDQEICIRSLGQGKSIILYHDLEAVHAGGVSRKSLSDHDRALRVMELVEAPLQCMARLQGHSLLLLRLIVLLGGVSRIMAAVFTGAVKTMKNRKNYSAHAAWVSKQQRLGFWFASWAIVGRLHDKEVSLAQYLQEYLPRTGSSISVD